MNWNMQRIVVPWLVMSAGTAAADSGSMTMKGTRFSFELVRSAGKSPTELGSGVMTGDGEGYRLLYDSKRGRFFGYTVRAAALPGGRFRLELGPLSADTIARIVEQHEKREKKTLVGASLGIEYPPAQDLRDGEPLLLELMANAATGEKLSDVIRVSRSGPASTDETSPARGRLRVVHGVMTVNGERLLETGGATGRHVYFALPGRGRFVLSLEAVPGFAFVPAELIDNRTVRFAAGGDAYEWTSAEPITSVSPAPAQLWIWHDADYRIRTSGSSFEIGVTSLLKRSTE